MKFFFLFLEFMIPIAGAYLLLKKGSLTIVYIPFLMFSATLLEQPKYIPGPFYLYLDVLFLLYFIIFNLPFFKRNIFSILLVLYYFYLSIFAKDFGAIKGTFIGVIWLFIAVSLIPEIYSNYKKERLFNELSNAAFLILALFCLNVILSTLFNYNPYELYGIKSGILFGKMSINIYNLFPYVLYIVLKRGVKENNLKFLIVYFIGIFFILLTMRRSVMLLSVLGSIFVMIELVKFDELKKLIGYGLVIISIFLLVASQTSFVDQFFERFEQRGLDDRPIEEEGRLMEFGLVYKDLFVYYDYDPWFGYGLFDSNGNYGKRIFGNRSLHTDPMNLLHSSGLIGLFLYIMMFGLAFYAVWLRILNRGEFFQYMIVALCFIVFFINGRYTTTPAMLMMLLILYLPFGKSEMKKKRILNKNSDLYYSNEKNLV